MDKKNADSVSPSALRKRVGISSKAEESDARSQRSTRSAGSARSAGSGGSGKGKSSGKSPQKGGKSGHAHEEGKHFERPDRKLTPELSKKCYGLDFKVEAQVCTKPPFNWQDGKYVRDECGSGMVPYTRNFRTGRSVWCRTPLSMYQATHGELGRQVLCQERKIVRDIRPAPPCAMCHSILPPCKGYYRKYECVRPCEEGFAITNSQGGKDYRDMMQRYWDPCVNDSEQGALDVNTFAHHNTALGMKMKRRLEDQPCW